MVKFKPVGNTVIVELDKEAEQSRGGIILPHAKVEQPITGKVVAVGNGKKFSNGTIAAMTCAVGDKVMFAKFAGNEYEIENQKFLVLTEDDIMAIIGEDK